MFLPGHVPLYAHPLNYQCSISLLLKVWPMMTGFVWDRYAGQTLALLTLLRVRYPSGEVQIIVTAPQNRIHVAPYRLSSDAMGSLLLTVKAL